MTSLGRNLAARLGLTERTQALAWFLGAMTLLQFGYPVMGYGRVWSGLYMLAYLGMIGFGILVVRTGSQSTRPLFLLGAFVVLFGSWFAFDQDERSIRFSLFAALGLFQLALFVSLSRFIIDGRSRSGRRQLILAALSEYLLLGGVFGVVFNLLELLAPGSFVDNTVPDQPMAFETLLYTSFVTLSTLGYGDVAAVSGWARSLASLEAVCGTLFLAVVIAQLVGGSPPQDPTGSSDAAASTGGRTEVQGEGS